MTLVEFLLARISEDEAAARAILCADYAEYAATWHLPASATVDVGDEVFFAGDRVLANHVVRHDPARVLAECEAKRRIVAHHARHPDSLGDPLGDLCAVCTEGGPDAQGWPCLTLRLLAMPYANHPDYREGWRT